MKTQILFRTDPSSLEEYNVSRKYFDVVQNRTDCLNSIVIPRYSCLPYYRELEKDLRNLKCTMINSYEQHQWIANFDYYEELKKYTFQTWTDHDFYQAPEGQYVVKGRTNSRKNAWKKLMFAENKIQALNIAAELMQDSLIATQGIIYRKYEKLKTLEIGSGDQPFVNEWRFFVYRDSILSYGYYWSCGEECLKTAKLDSKAMDLVGEIIDISKNYVNFYVIDIAQKENGDWVMVELNDGSMSGLSENDPEKLYNNLKIQLTKTF
jgi:hypothetical protein